MEQPARTQNPPSIGHDLSVALDLFGEKIPILAMVALRGSVLMGLALLAGGTSAWVLLQVFPDSGWRIYSLAAVLVFSLAGGAALWAGTAVFVASCRNTLDSREAFRGGLKGILSLTWIGLLFGGLVTGGTIVGIVPGMLMGVLFYFAPYVYLFEGFTGLDALIRSAQYVRPRFFDISTRLAVAWLIVTLLSLVPFLGFFVGFFSGPYFVFHGLVVFRNLAPPGEASAYVPNPRVKMGLLIGGGVLPGALVLWGLYYLWPYLHPLLGTMETGFSNISLMWNFFSGGKLPY